jgi:hypothetical protein
VTEGGSLAAQGNKKAQTKNAPSREYKSTKQKNAPSNTPAPNFQGPTKNLWKTKRDKKTFTSKAAIQGRVNVQGGGAGRPWQNAKQLRHTRRQAASAELEIAESCSPACRRRRPCPAEQENLSLQLPKKTKKHQLVPILPGQCRNSRQKRQKKKRAKDATENKRSVTAKIAPIMPSIT